MPGKELLVDAWVEQFALLQARLRNVKLEKSKVVNYIFYTLYILLVDLSLAGSEAINIKN